MTHYVRSLRGLIIVSEALSIMQWEAFWRRKDRNNSINILTHLQGLIEQGSTNKILNAYASVRFILIRGTPSQGPRTRNITKLFVNSKYNILFTCFLVFFHLWPSNPKKPTPKNQRLTKRNKVTSLFRSLNLF